MGSATKPDEEATQLAGQGTARPDPSGLTRYKDPIPIGAGGMGAVFRAYDETLGREVALKLLQATEGGSSSPQNQARMIREARAMAQLSHPNVLPIYDVYSDGDQVVISMELVHGPTLKQWLEERPAWQDVIDVLLQAGEGLVHAHEHGLVHRDFKPANVMIGEKGRVRVLDFGLARDVGTVEASSSEGTADDASMTQTGVVMGTPAYMAPEQHAGEAADERSDQFSFCVCLWEALAGRRPYRGGNLHEAKRAGPHPLPSRAAPRAVERVVLRGLAADPDDRYGSMSALLADLQRARHPRSRLGWVAGAVGVAAVAALSLGLGDAPAGSAQPAFATLDANYVDPPAPEYAEEVRSIRAQLRQTREDLRQGRIDQTRSQLTSLLERARATSYGPIIAECLVIDGYLHAELGMLSQAVESLESAHRIAIESGDDSAAFHAAAKLTSMHAHDLRDSDRSAEWMAHAEVALKRLGDPPHQQAAMELLRASHAGVSGSVDATFEHLAAAIALEESRAHPDPIWLALIRINVGAAHGRTDNFAKAEAEYEVALAQLEALLGEEHLSVAFALSELGGAEHGQDKHDEAEKHLVRSVELYRRLAPNHPDLAGSLLHLGNLYSDTGRHERAAEAITEAIAVGERAIGTDHPVVVLCHQAYGRYLRQAKRFDEASEVLEKAIVLHEGTSGTDSTQLAQTLSELGDVRIGQHRYPEALELHGRALELLEAKLDDGHRELEEQRFMVGERMFALGGDQDKARKLVQQAHEACEANPELDPPMCAAIGRWLIAPSHP